jgi:hypothetical protein
MILALIYLVAPVVVYVTLAALPRGRSAVVGLAFAAFVLALAWVTQLLSLPPLFTGDGHTDAYMSAALTIWTGAVFAAGLAQGLRMALRPGARLAYLLLSAAVFVFAAVPALWLLGV